MANVQLKQFTIAELVAGLDVTIVGDENTLINGVGTLDNALPGQLTFLTNSTYKKYLEKTHASAVILTKEDASHCQAIKIISRDPYYTYAKMAAYFLVNASPTQAIHPSAIIGDGCLIDATASIGPNTVIGNGVTVGSHVVIGPNCTIGDYSLIGDSSALHANVTLYHHVEIGQEVIIASGTVIGGDGFGIKSLSWVRLLLKIESKLV
jgi:UDP-3-O-[3-hydroxymyristoyl] glucosamine N-acyltransferase